MIGGLTMLLSGCTKSPPTMAHYRPVSHWVLALRDPDPAARVQAVRILSNVGPADPAVLIALIGAIKDRDVQVRREAILALLKLGPAAKSATPALREAQADEDAAVREYAARALRRIDSGR
jgi:HEAT repeat protein